MPAPPAFSVVIPVHQNEETLRSLHRRLTETFDQTIRQSVELIFVDDASRDGSLTTLRALTRTDGRIGLIALTHQTGQHAAVLLGLAHARGARCIVMDADLQDPPEAIPSLIREAERSGADAVFAGRRGRYESGFRLATSRLFKWMLHLVARVPTDAGMFVLLSRAMVERLLAMRGADPFVVAMIGCTGLELRSVPVVRQRRCQGQSAYSFRLRLLAARHGLIWALRWRLGLTRTERDGALPPRFAFSTEGGPFTRCSQRSA